MTVVAKPPRETVSAWYSCAGEIGDLHGILAARQRRILKEFVNNGAGEWGPGRDESCERAA